MSNATEADPAMIAKIVDLPPYGPRNADPLSDDAGAHPIEVGIGAALTGAVGGMAAGVVGGPIGVVLGAVGGALIGGVAGKDVGEVIDATTDVRCNAADLKPRPDSVDVDAERRAFRFGADVRDRYPDQAFADVESEIAVEWAENEEVAHWDAVREIVRLGFGRGESTPPTTG